MNLILGKLNVGYVSSGKLNKAGSREVEGHLVFECNRERRLWSADNFAVFVCLSVDERLPR